MPRYQAENNNTIQFVIIYSMAISEQCWFEPRLFVVLFVKQLLVLFEKTRFYVTYRYITQLNFARIASPLQSSVILVIS